jgi:hypothetical protein
MNQVAIALQHFLCENNIDPNKVKVVLRCDDIQTAALLERAAITSLEPMTTFFQGGQMLSGMTRLTLRGIKFVITQLDRSAA